MITGSKYISVYAIINKVYRDMGMSDAINLNDAIEWAGEAMEFIGAALSYIDKTKEIEIKDYKGTLPCGLHYIETASASAYKHDEVDEDCEYKPHYRQMRYSTDAYHHTYCANNRDCNCISDLTYKVNDDSLYTNFEEGSVLLAYKSIPVDDEGYPMIPDDVKFKNAVAYHIMYKLAFIKFMAGKISQRAYDIIDRDRDFYIGAANTRANLPSVDMAESIKNNWIRLIPKINQHADGFKSAGSAEQRNTHNSYNGSRNIYNNKY